MKTFIKTNFIKKSTRLHTGYMYPPSLFNNPHPNYNISMERAREPSGSRQGYPPWELCLCKD